MTLATRAKIPAHLSKYIVKQNYARYNAEDQAVWRYIMRQLKTFLAVHGHPVYIEGLRKTGIDIERIPRIEDVDAHLNRFGWGAVPVSGFIPPAAFMEFQAIGVLPIASDMRALDHLLYTPAPDIVHEAAGHAPILAHPEYAAYLRLYGEVARRSILSQEDMNQYEAIRILSDLKENPNSTAAEIRAAEKRLQEVNAAMSFVSEAALLSRMNWWTAEYGLIGDLKNPRIFGAGLLSSVGEARACLEPKVRKIPLSVDCVNYSYDITEPQPQLFVARDFRHLSEVLEELALRMSYRKGGTHGLERAKQAKTVNTAELNSGLQISGVLVDFMTAEVAAQSPVYLQFSGPCQLAFKDVELPEQGVKHHPQGFSSPVGYPRNSSKCLSTLQETDLAKLGLVVGQRARLEFESGVRVEGVVKSFTFRDERLLLITWTDCRASLADKVLFDPQWGVYDMAVGSMVKSVAGGPADRDRFGETADFVAQRVPVRKYSAAELKRHALFAQVRTARENGEDRFAELRSEFVSDKSAPWLAGLELLELGLKLGRSETELLELRRELETRGQGSVDVRRCIDDGLIIADKSL
ncbi:MAG TPA: aromatic amino acid hydroxylase [Bdellovibrionales bacterium]|nr:aromatic amino acid hydroxylase [Bdellovibrionales bacterium]